MGSSLTWLDFSEADQKRSREVIQLFSLRESRDELGIGVVRDILSDAMFPGTSVLHQRARYLLFIPWLFKIGCQKKTGSDLLKYVDTCERKLIVQLKNGSDLVGLIGREAGIKLKVLPSVMYWNGLQRWEILRIKGTRQFVAEFRNARNRGDDAATEGVEEKRSLWDRNIPPAPDGFPNNDAMTFNLTPLEAGWLSERILDTCGGSVLGWCAQNGFVPNNTAFPWDETGFESLPTDLEELVCHAKNFSLLIQGAALIYNFLLATKREDLGFDALERSEAFRQEFDEWADVVRAGHSFSDWDFEAFWQFVVQRSGGRGLPQSFVDSWLAMCRSSNVADLISNPEALKLIEKRETTVKGSKSRLANEKLLRNWGGRSGTRRLSYRWAEVQMLLSDINDGLNRA